MENTTKIVVADRNPNVRNFLKRELAALGIRVCLADNADKLLKTIDSQPPTRMLVLDPDLPGVENVNLYRKLANRAPQLPVILYCVRGADNPPDSAEMEMVRIEKDGNSIEILKNAVQDIIVDH